MAAVAAAGGMSAGAGATSAAGIMAGTLGGVLQAGMSFGLNAASTSKAHDRQKNMMTRGPSYIMQGLRAAGINPILAAGSAGLGGLSAKAPQAGSATVSSGNIPQALLMRKQMALADATTAKTLAETGITAAGQPAADWNAQYNLTEPGKRLLEMERVNNALPNSVGGAAARGAYQLWSKGQRDFRPDSGRWPVRIQSPAPHNREDNQ